MASVKPTNLAAVAKTGQLAARPPVAAPAADNLGALLQSLALRKGYDLTDDEQRVLRACLCLSGAELSVRGLCDLDFFVAFESFQTGLGEAKTGLSTATIGNVLRAASLAVGGTGRYAVVKAAWFDAFEAPRYLRELSSVALLIRTLRQAGKKA